MTEPITIAARQLPVLKFTLVLMVVIGILFPCIFAFINSETSMLTLLKDVLITTLVEIITALIIYAIISVFNRMLRPNIVRWWRYPVELVLTLAADFYLLYTLYSVTRGISSGPMQLLNMNAFRLFIAVNMAGTTGIYVLVTSLNLYQVMLEKTAQSEKLQQEYSQVRLQALKSQVNPHFLFNSLSVLSSLVHVSAETSEKFIVQLAKAYRYILEQKDADMVTLKEELEFLDAYFFLLQIRFEKKIGLEKSINLVPVDWQLPPLTLQLLVENVVKHNRMSAAEPMVIRIIATDGAILVENRNNPRTEQEHSTGIGLENIKSRVAYVTDKQVSIVQDKEIFRVVVPLVKKDHFNKQL